MKKLSEVLIVIQSITNYKEVRDHEAYVVSIEVELQVIRVFLVEYDCEFKAFRSKTF